MFNVNCQAVCWCVFASQECKTALTIILNSLFVFFFFVFCPMDYIDLLYSSVVEFSTEFKCLGISKNLNNGVLVLGFQINSINIQNNMSINLTKIFGWVECIESLPTSFINTRNCILSGFSFKCWAAEDSSIPVKFKHHNSSKPYLHLFKFYTEM